MKAHTLEDGTDYYGINPHGYVPLLEIDDGHRLTEGPVIIQYVADQVKDKRLAPPWGTMERYRFNEWLSFIHSELHQTLGLLFKGQLPNDVEVDYHKRVLGRFQWLERQLEGKVYVMGETFTAADAYLFVVAGWGKYVGVDLSSFENLQSVLARVADRPSVQEALNVEGLG